MNRIQKRVFLITLGLLVFMAICPPWHIQASYEGIPFLKNLGYWWIVDPPTFIGKSGNIYYGKINYLPSPSSGLQPLSAVQV